MKRVLVDEAPAEIQEALNHHPLTRDVPQTIRAHVLADCRVRTLFPGDVLIHQFEQATTCYLLLSGSLEVVVGEAGHQRLVDTLTPGALVGEMGALTNQLRSATVRAPMESHVVEFRGQALSQLLKSSGAASRYMLNLLGARLAATDNICDELSRNLEPSTPLPQGTFSRLYQRLIGSRLQHPAFLGLMSFVLVASIVRILALVVPGLQESALFLKGTYLTGALLFIVSTFFLFTGFTQGLVRGIALGLGIGAGLFVNNLSLLIAFDLFYPELGTTERAANFSYAVLYQRSESLYALAGATLLLILLTYFRGVFRAFMLFLKGLMSF